MDSPSPPFSFTRESQIRIDADGHIWHEGEPVLHEGLARALASWVDFDDATGRYVMRNRLGWCFVTVDRTPLVVRRVLPRGPSIEMELSDGTQEPLRAETLRVAPDGAVFAYVRNGSLLAGFERSAAFALLEHAITTETGYALRIGEHEAPITFLREGESPPPRPDGFIPSTSGEEDATRSPDP